MGLVLMKTPRSHVDQLLCEGTRLQSNQTEEKCELILARSGSNFHCHSISIVVHLNQSFLDDGQGAFYRSDENRTWVHEDSCFTDFSLDPSERKQIKSNHRAKTTKHLRALEVSRCWKIVTAVLSTTGNADIFEVEVRARTGTTEDVIVLGSRLGCSSDVLHRDSTINSQHYQIESV
jgi:hypothetical protein